jgi:hypothetical protein
MATAATTAPAKMRALQYEAYGEGAAGLKVINASRSPAVLYGGVGMGASLLSTLVNRDWYV